MFSNFSKRASLIIFILSMICILLIGLILGFLSYPFLVRKILRNIWTPIHPYYTRDDTTTDYGYVARRDILYHKPGSESIWSYKYEEIPVGNGKIKGSIFINDEPAKGLNIALIIAPGKKTKTVTVDSNGNYTIPIAQGTYHFNGVVIYNGKDEIDNKIFVNKITQGIQRLSLKPLTETDSIIKELDKLIEKYGEKKALEEMAKRLPNTFQNKFQFTVKDEPFTFSPFHYRDPVRIIVPSDGSSIPLEELKFVWLPYPGAHSYTIEITHIIKKGTTTSYYPVALCNDIKETNVEFEELYNQLKVKSKFENDYIYSTSKKLKKNNMYGFRVFAFGENNEVISASNEFGYKRFFVK